ncbi:MAG: intradiol ring-cleavage dioxygenase [Phycisphaerae bacterium]|nr:intradiol ring-cleavage dioxygenase [Gemmatimonadaceae bacterium]
MRDISDSRNHDDAPHEDYGGLHRDLVATGSAMSRRNVLRMAASVGASAGLLQLLGCNTASDINGTDNGDGSGTGACSRIPTETAGPFPGDGSNGANVLNVTGVVRNDIRTSFGTLSGTAAGVPLTIALTLVSASTCAPLANRAVYLWHCDRAGLYSLYSAGVTNQNYLRGVAQTDANGQVSITSIFPACYAGRWPHIHFEVFASLASATNVANKIATSQIALPKATCDLVYATSGYSQSIQNLSQVTLASDNVFSDGSALELATCTGNVTSGITASLTIAV